jgi:hypothetical protein
MSQLSPILVIELYEEHRPAIERLLLSILSCFAEDNLFERSSDQLAGMLNSLCEYYPFISLLYLLDKDGKQINRNIPGRHYKDQPCGGGGADRSSRPYFLAAQQSSAAEITEPYLSSIKNELCISICGKVLNADGPVRGYWTWTCLSH